MSIEKQIKEFHEKERKIEHKESIQRLFTYTKKELYNAVKNGIKKYQIPISKLNKSQLIDLIIKFRIKVTVSPERMDKLLKKEEVKKRNISEFSHVNAIKKHLYKELSGRVFQEMLTNFGIEHKKIIEDIIFNSEKSKDSILKLQKLTFQIGIRATLEVILNKQIANMIKYYSLNDNYFSDFKKSFNNHFSKGDKLPFIK